MSLREAIKWSLSKRESQLKSVENRNQKMSVVTHRPVAVLGVRMSIHTIQRKRDFGSTDPEPRLCGNMVTWRPMLTTSTGGVFA